MIGRRLSPWLGCKSQPEAESGARSQAARARDGPLPSGSVALLTGGGIPFTHRAAASQAQALAQAYYLWPPDPADYVTCPGPKPLIGQNKWRVC